MDLAHGLGGRSDLPIPFALALYGGGMAVLLSFALLGLLWPKARLNGEVDGRPLPARLAAALDSETLRAALQLLVTLIAAAVLFIAWAGPQRVSGNLAPWVLYITFWVGLVPLSLLFGPVWKIVNPLRAVHSAAAVFTRRDPDDGRDLPDWVGRWPAAAWLTVFVWLELVYPDRGEPRTVAVFLTVYAVVNLAAAWIYGTAWFAQGDGFEVYSTTIARMAPLGRRGDGRLVIRNPLSGLDGTVVDSGLVAVVAVLMGSAGFDGLTRTRMWTDNVDPDSIPIGTLGLAGCTAFVGVTYVVAARLAARSADVRSPDMPAAFAHSLIPIAVGYTVAHYFSLFVLDGQIAAILASDPLEYGWNLLGTRDWSVNYVLVSPGGIALVQVGAIVIGHVLGVIAAHDRAVKLMRGRAATQSQYPLLAVMVAYTLGGIALLLGA